MNAIFYLRQWIGHERMLNHGKLLTARWNWFPHNTPSIIGRFTNSVNHTNHIKCYATFENKGEFMNYNTMIKWCSAARRVAVLLGGSSAGGQFRFRFWKKQKKHWLRFIKAERYNPLLPPLFHSTAREMPNGLIWDNSAPRFCFSPDERSTP